MKQKFLRLIQGFFLTGVATVYAQSVNRPNILICIADDAGHMSAYGTKWVCTPAFDTIARQGILFNNMYTCNAKSAPSRATIITGRNSWQLEAACNHWADFPSKFKSYPEALLEKGYEVGYTGKGWGPGRALAEDGTPRNLTGKEWNQKKAPCPTKGISNIDYAENFKSFLNHRDKDKPFCFWYGSYEPHRKYEFGSSERFGKNLSDIDSVPPYWPDNDRVRRDMLDYAVEVEHFDHHLQHILKILEESGELDNTIIIATSDHNMPFPRCKGQDYFQSNHVPMAIMWKNGIYKPGRTIDEFISTIDIAPTLLEAAGINQKDAKMQPITGRSFMGLLTGESLGDDRNYVLLGKERHDVGRPHDVGFPIRGIIRGDYLYIRNFEIDRWPAGNPSTGYMNVDGSPTKTEVLKTRKDPERDFMWRLSFGKRLPAELYNIKKDPFCMNNLIGEECFKEVIDKLQKELFTRLVEQEDPRVLGYGEVFDLYPNLSSSHNYWERVHDGEKLPANWIRESDFEYDLEE